MNKSMLVWKKPQIFSKNERQFLVITEMGKTSQSLCEKTFAESLFKTKHLEACSLIKTKTLSKVFYYDFVKFS